MQFKWACFGLAAVFVSGMLWIANDVRLRVKRMEENAQPTLVLMKERLPPTLENIKSISESSKKAADKVDAYGGLMDLGSTSPGETGSLEYSKALGKFLVEKLPEDTKIGADGRLGWLRGQYTKQEWIGGAGIEMLQLATRGKTKQEILVAVCQDASHVDWYFNTGPNGEAVRLLDWVIANHPESAKLVPLLPPGLYPKPDPKKTPKK
jgi:hypothetical protein